MRERPGLFLAAVLLLIFSCVVSLAIGAVNIPPEAFLVLIGRPLGLGMGEISSVHEAILLQIRLPRIVLGALVGASLALAGAAFQGLFRNPLAGPYVLGVSSGASFGAVLAMVLGLHLPLIGVGSIPVTAFLGALVSIFTVYHLARRGDTIDVTTMLLAGIAVSAVFSALVSLLLTFASDRVIGGAVFWMMGGLSSATWQRVLLVSPAFLIGAAVIWFLAQPLNTFLLGEEQAYHLGTDIVSLKRVVLITASLLTAAAVAASGAIGFVGLVIPHIVRLFVGPNHFRLLPGAVLFGAAFLIIADTVARTVMAPIEIQVGILTALMGGPFFLYLLRQYHTGRSSFGE